MSQNTNNTYHFISSNGDLYVNRDGTINQEKSDIDDWLLDIAKVDLEELEHYYKLNEIEGGDLDGDVLDFGYWDKKGSYHQPDTDWRNRTFHNGFLGKNSIKEVLIKSELWISINRTN